MFIRGVKGMLEEGVKLFLVTRGNQGKFAQKG